MGMKPEVAKALDASIRHWEENIAAEFPSEASCGSHACALCRLFHTNHAKVSLSCRGCPVFEHTGRAFCSETPYEEAQNARGLWASAVSEGDTLKEIEAKREAFRKAAQDELDFLKSLQDSK